MSAWRRVATSMLPELRQLIEHSESVGMLWVELILEFQDAHREPANENVIRGVYDFARWCVSESGNDDIATSAVIGFYEDLPTDKRVRERLPQHMTRPEFLGFVEVFKYNLSPEEHEDFLRDFLKRRELLERRAK